MSVWIRRGDRLYRYPSDAEYAVGVLMYLRADGLATATPTEAQLGLAVPAPPTPHGLEPTTEQIDKIATAISVASSDAYALENPRDVELEGAARAMWRLIAPMVLEAAAQACEQIRSKVEPASLDMPLLEFTQKDHEAAGVLKCIAAIRAMKGGG